MHYTFIYSIDVRGFERLLRAEFNRVFEALDSNLNNPVLAFFSQGCISVWNSSWLTLDHGMCPWGVVLSDLFPGCFLFPFIAEYLASLVVNSSRDAFSCVPESKNSKCASSYSLPPLSPVPLAHGKVTAVNLVDLWTRNERCWWRAKEFCPWERK